MKTIIVLISLISTLTYAANDTDLIHTVPVTHIVVQVASVDSVIASVQINSKGVLTATKRDKTTKSLNLSDVNKQNLLWSAQMLAESEIETETRTMICKMMIAPFSIQNLAVFDSATRSMKLVLSASSCALSSYTHPKEAYAMDAAQALKAQMLVLAHQLVK